MGVSDKTKEALAELSKEFRGIVSDRPPTEAELQRAQNTMTLKLPGSHETIDEVGNSILEIVRFGLPDDYYDTFVRKVQSLNVQAVTDTAKSTIRPDNLVWVVVGDRSKIEAPIRPQNLDEVDSITRSIAHDIRSQYTLAYNPGSNIGNGYQKIRVEARGPAHGHLIVRTRSGYYPGEAVK